MKQRTLIGRLLSPAGFGLVLLLFGMPFVAVSCAGGGGTVTATFTGLDLVVGGAPDFAGGDIGPDEQEYVRELFADQYDIEPLAVIAAIVLLAAMGVGLIRERLARHAIGTGLAVLAGGLLIGAVLRAIDQLERVRRSNVVGAETDLPPGVGEPRYGFWLAICVLGLLAVGHGAALLAAWRAPTPAPAESPPAEPPPEPVHLSPPPDRPLL